MSVGGEENEAGAATGSPAQLPEQFCSACGKTGVANQDLKQCNGCKCVWYCGAACQKAHWKSHKKECKLIGLIVKKHAKSGSPPQKPDSGNDVERDGDAVLFAQPTRDDCDICMRALPIEVSLCTYMPCCGKMICCGCSYECVRATKAINEKKAKKNQKFLQNMCAFCRQPTADSPEIAIRQMEERVELGDSQAMKELALVYREGQQDGVPQDNAKAFHLLRRSVELGNIDAQNQLGMFYLTGNLGLEIDQTKAMVCFERAAASGYVTARYSLGQLEYHGGNVKRAIRHWHIAAAAGFDKAVMRLMSCFEEGFITLEELAGYMQARDKAAIEMNSEERQRAKKFLISIGRYTPYTHTISM